MQGETRYRRGRRLRSPIRTIPIVGYGDDAGVWFRCWYCGFPCKVGQDELGGGELMDGTAYSAYSDAAAGATSGDELSALPTLRGFDHNFVALKSDSSGIGVAPVIPYDVSGSGCPLCHTLNWDGKL